MRYLYGDSVPFPPQYDFLAALDVFCAQAARVVRLEAESRAQWKAVEETITVRSAEADELDVFHAEALNALRDGANESPQALVRDYVSQLSALAQRIVDETRRQVSQANDREAHQTKAECDHRRIEVREALEKLLVAVRLPVSETHIQMKLDGGVNQLSALFTYEGDLVAGFTLSAAELEEWRAPRKVSDFAQAVTLPVGVKRSLFKRTVAKETITLDDYIVAAFELHDDRCELALRKRADTTDSLVFSVFRTDDRLRAEVHHPDDVEAESGLPATLDASSATEVERLWQLLRTACSHVLAKKKTMVALSLAGLDVIEHDLGTRVVANIVKALAPVVSEVGRRSPNAHELSLKLEDEMGRREEIYLRKAQLVSSLSTVTPGERGVFDPLGLIASGAREKTETLSEEVILAE